ncbi:MAG: response regulator [Anaerolineales bacterium]|nr:response regulator [Anaerolineales bacterium]
MADFWVLIVDDEDGVLSVLKNSLRKLGDQFRVSTASGGEEAMDMLIQRKYDLVVTDYKMAGMNGLELLEKIHAVHPKTRVILMTAYGSAAVESEASRLQAYRYLPKPLEIDAFRQIVREAAGDALPESSGILVLSEKDYREVDRVLCQLQGDVAARCILLADSEGRCLARAGNVENFDLTQLASLLGGSMTTLGEAGKAVDPSDGGVNLAFREGKQQDLYAVNVGSFLLVIVIDRGPFSTRLGSVWYSAQKAVVDLREKFRTADMRTTEKTIGQDMEQALYGELQKIFVEAGPAGRASTADKTRPSGGKPDHPALLTYEEAVRDGIIPDA